MTVDDLVTLGPTARSWRASGEPSSEWRVHVAVYAARPDARALVHTHSEHATALERGSASRCGGPTCSPRRCAPSGSDEIATAAVAALGDRDAVLLGRHGVLAVGEHAGEARSRRAWRWRRSRAAPARIA